MITQEEFNAFMEYLENNDYKVNPPRENGGDYSCTKKFTSKTRDTVLWFKFTPELELTNYNISYERTLVLLGHMFCMTREEVLAIKDQ